MKTNSFRLITLFLTVSVSFWLVGCGSDDDTPTNPGGGGGAFYPLAIGNYWISDAQDFTNNVLDSAYIDTFKIDTSMSYSGKTWYGMKGDDAYLRSDVTGVYQIIDNMGTFTSEIPVYKPTAAVGQQWKVAAFGDTITVEVRSINETVTCPSGTYTGCHRYFWSFSGGEFTNEITFKSGIGAVKVISGSSFFGITARSEMLLKSYHIM